ncbi:MAG TPA: S41 family peptidase [Ignavibacteria bacterium]|nr:S41 family peptidase [Ignavibacteria bacterium]
MNEQTLQNFRAFTKLYGYIRFFHPSDEASSIDWDKFAVYGFEKVENARDDNELKALLLELFLQVAPAIEIYFTGENFTYDQSKIIPADTTGLLPVAWQHKGIQDNMDTIYGIYKSTRINRIPPIINHSAILSKTIDVQEFRGKKIRIEAGIKFELEEKDVKGELWIKSLSENGTQSGYNSNRFPFGKWKKYSVEIEITDEVSQVEYGVTLYNEGVLFVNGFKLEVYDAGKWKSAELNDGRFDKQTFGKSPENWNIVNSDYLYEIIDFDTFDNDKACFIQSCYKKQPFEKYPLPGELINKPISGSLSCIVPLALYSDTAGTLPHADRDTLNNLQAILEESKFSELSADSKYVRLAGAAKLWNVIQHSYPYFELYNIDWNGVLNDALKFAMISKNGVDFLKYLQIISANLNDGHAGAAYSKHKFNYCYPPFLLDHAEGEYVISRIFEEGTGLLEGDVVFEIDGKDVHEFADEEGELISSATDGSRINGILWGRLTKGEKDSIIKMKISRDGVKLNAETKRNFKFSDVKEQGYYPEYRPEKISEVKRGIFYVDLTRLTTEELDEKIPELAEAKGVIFDVRGYPRLSCDFLNNLSDKKLFSAKWNVPQIIYPDYENLVGFDTSERWEMGPLEPQFKGKVVFMINGGAISYAESIMGIVEAYSLGEIIGEQTAGTNGNINPIYLPGGYTVWFTGMKVLKHDDTPHHGVGIHPTIPVSRTIKGIREKRDEYLEKAIEVIENAR